MGPKWVVYPGLLGGGRGSPSIGMPWRVGVVRGLELGQRGGAGEVGLVCLGGPPTQVLDSICILRPPAPQPLAPPFRKRPQAPFALTHLSQSPA